MINKIFLTRDKRFILDSLGPKNGRYLIRLMNEDKTWVQIKQVSDNKILVWSFGENVLNKKARLRKEIAEIEKEIAKAGRVKPQFLIDDDEYQDQLELSYHLDELRDQKERLESILNNLK